MRVYSFFKKDRNRFLENLREVSNKDSPDLFILFLPPVVYLDREFFSSLSKTLSNSEYITLSAVGVMKDDEIGYNHFGGFSLKFEKDGFHEVLFIEDFSKVDLERLEERLREFLKEYEHSTYLMFSTSAIYLNTLLNRVFKRSDFPKVRLYGGVASSNLIS